MTFETVFVECVTMNGKKFISHRGNIDQRIPEKENTWEYVMAALDQGYDVEVDVWYKKGRFALGHDGPMEEVHPTFFLSQGLWIHCKDIRTMLAFTAIRKQAKYINYFFHDQDDMALTSQGVFWTFPGKELTPASVAVLPEDVDGDWRGIDNCLGVCSDYIQEYRNKME